MQLVFNFNNDDFTVWQLMGLFMLGETELTLEEIGVKNV